MIDDAQPTLYDREFYAHHQEGVLRSARAVIPIILNNLSVSSAVDLGCGSGAWLRAAEECGVRDVTGYDGGYVDSSTLLIDPANFRPVDLCANFEVGRTCDLAISLEVAEHLPSEPAKRLIKCLVDIAPMVLFSAAIPGQGGVGHINERWQDYWRTIFYSYGFYPADLIRSRIWGNPTIEFWYQQNIILYCSEEAIEQHPQLAIVAEDVSLNVVHPRLFENRVRELKPTLRKVLKAMPSLISGAVARRVGLRGTSPIG